MESIVSETLNLLKAVTPPMIELHTQTKGSENVVKADPIQMQQVVMNLCTNAIQAMDEGGGVLRVALTKQRWSGHDNPPHPNLSPGEYVVLEVSDTGPGMDSEIAKKIFDPFFTTKPRDKGTGLGLSMVHGIVTSAGGAVLVDSSPGTGATFRVYLPRSLEHPEAAGHGEEHVMELKGEGTLLLVEDESLVMRVEQEILEGLGYHVVACSSPLEAREIFEDNPARFNLVITDYAMPDMSGLELASSIKETAPNIPVLLCTGYNQDISSHELKLFGVDQTLMKPFTARELNSTLQEMLKQKSDRESGLAVS
jgi:two-component system, cell cycle sensor histidine kinase and response regulator CckA